jgi:1-acyl-sn-glycerol-3-phosphate acyltransferase
MSNSSLRIVTSFFSAILKQGAGPISKMTLTIFIRSTIFHISLAFIAVTYLILLPLILFPRPITLSITRSFLRTKWFLLKTICGLSLEVRGLQYVPQGPALIASKHQSTAEILALQMILTDPAMITKAQNLRLPIVGWVLMKLGHLPIDRSHSLRSLVRLFGLAKERVRAGRQVVIFPEGTRRAPASPPKYLLGVAFLYKKLALPCTPVALNAGLFWRRRSFVRKPGVIVIEFLPAIPPGLQSGEFMATLVDNIESAAARLSCAPGSILAAD